MNKKRNKHTQSRDIARYSPAHMITDNCGRYLSTLDNRQH